MFMLHYQHPALSLTLALLSCFTLPSTLFAAEKPTAPSNPSTPSVLSESEVAEFARRRRDAWEKEPGLPFEYDAGADPLRSPAPSAPPTSRQDQKALVAYKAPKVAKLPDPERKVRAAVVPPAYHFGPSVYPTGNVATITRESQRSELILGHTVTLHFDDKLHANFCIGNDPQSTATYTHVSDDDIRPLVYPNKLASMHKQYRQLFMSNGDFAISTTRWNELSIHHWGLFDDDSISRKDKVYNQLAAHCDKRGLVHRRTLLAGHIPYHEFFCTANPSCTQAITLDKRLRYVALYAINHKPDGSAHTQKKKFTFAETYEYIPLFFETDTQFVVLNPHSSCTYRMRLAMDKMSEIRSSALGGSVQQIILKYYKFGLSATMKMADGRQIRIDPDADPAA